MRSLGWTIAFLVSFTLQSLAQTSTAPAPSPPIVQSTDTLSIQHDRGIINQLGISQLLTIIAERDRLYGQRFDAQEKANVLALKSLEEALASRLSFQKDAIEKAERATEKRFDSVNEFRTTLKDQQLLLVTRSEVTILFNGIERRLAEMSDLLSKNTNRSEGANSLWVIIAGVLGVIGMFAGVIFGLWNKSRDKQVRAGEAIR